jgi:hypothetical protein
MLSVCAWYFAGISGEVFLVDHNGKAQPAPGAAIVIYPVKDWRKSGAAYSVSNISGSDKHLARLLKLAQGERQHPADERIEPAVQLVQQTYCQDLHNGRAQFFGSPVEETTTDRNGRFAARLRPGNYAVFVEGQASNRHAVWIQDIPLRWRSEIRLVETLCDYSVE